MITVVAGATSRQIRYRKNWTAEEYMRKAFEMEDDYLPSKIFVNHRRQAADFVIEEDDAVVRFEARDASHPPPASRAGQAERRRQQR